MTTKLASIMLADVTAVRLTIGVCALLFAFGLMFANAHNGAYDEMIKMAPPWVWSIAFFCYGSAKFMIVCEWPRPINRIGALLVVLLGSYLWLFTIISFANNPNRPMGAADMMLVYLVLAEVWVGANTLERAEKHG
jgi:hypothetical protein